MKRISLLIIAFVITFIGFAQSNHPVTWEINSVKVDAGTFDLKIEAKIKAPWHIYSQNPASVGLGMPTQISFEENNKIELVGDIEERGVDQKEDEILPYFSKGVTFTQTLKLKSKEVTALYFTIKYMACTNQMCLPPSTKEFSITLNGESESDVPNDNEILEDNSKNDYSYNYENFEMPDTEGVIVASKAITAKSKFTFIDFWASWCAPCRLQGKELMPFYNKYHPQGFEVIAISLDTDLNAWKRAIEADGYTWTNLSDLKGFQSDLAKKYKIVAIPRNLLINNKGEIVAENIHGDDLQTLLTKLFE